jgi:hypothetical protein
MSVSHWWFGLLLDDAEHDRVRRPFEEAATGSPTTPAEQQVFATWIRDPARFDDQDPDDPFSSASGDELNAFIAAFDLPGFRELALRLIQPEGDLHDLFDEGRIFRFTMLARNTPASVVWQALGPDRALQLPGRLGNLLLRPSQIAAVHDEVVELHRGTTPAGLFARARRYCESSVGNVEDLKGVVTFLPDGLRKARDEGKGFLSLGCMEY